MKDLAQQIFRLKGDRRGLTKVEYVILFAVLAIAVVVAWEQLGRSVVGRSRAARGTIAAMQLERRAVEDSPSARSNTHEASSTGTAGTESSVHTVQGSVEFDVSVDSSIRASTEAAAASVQNIAGPSTEGGTGGPRGGTGAADRGALESSRAGTGDGGDGIGTWLGRAGSRLLEIGEQTAQFGAVAVRKTLWAVNNPLAYSGELGSMMVHPVRTGRAFYELGRQTVEHTAAAAAGCATEGDAVDCTDTVVTAAGAAWGAGPGWQVARAAGNRVAAGASRLGGTKRGGSPDAEDAIAKSAGEDAPGTWAETIQGLSGPTTLPSGVRVVPASSGDGRRMAVIAPERGHSRLNDLAANLKDKTGYELVYDPVKNEQTGMTAGISYGEQRIYVSTEGVQKGRATVAEAHEIDHLVARGREHMGREDPVTGAAVAKEGKGPLSQVFEERFGKPGAYSYAYRYDEMYTHGRQLRREAGQARRRARERDARLGDAERTLADTAQHGWAVSEQTRRLAAQARELAERNPKAVRFREQGDRVYAVIDRENSVQKVPLGSRVTRQSSRADKEAATVERLREIEQHADRAAEQFDDYYHFVHGKQDIAPDQYVSRARLISEHVRQSPVRRSSDGER